MKYTMYIKFKANINGVELDNEQSYNYLKEFIEKIENIFNLDINSKIATEFLQNQLNEETEFLCNNGIEDHEEAHNEALCSLFSNNYIIVNLLKYSKNKIRI